jgi:hypothetical protein
MSIGTCIGSRARKGQRAVALRDVRAAPAEVACGAPSLANIYFRTFPHACTAAHAQ